VVLGRFFTTTFGIPKSDNEIDAVGPTGPPPQISTLV
jgi:hypothetical protein